MRWQGQMIDGVDAAALPGLESMAGLQAMTGHVRTVTTPEFAGMTFHEVHAKSALNHVPGASAMPFDWTVNPYRGCSHACAYCVAPDTLVLCADGRQRRIDELEVGDSIMGTEQGETYRHYVPTRVLAKWTSRKRAFRVTLADGTEIVASGDHRFLSDRGWKHVTGTMSGADQRPFLTTSNRLMGFGQASSAAHSVRVTGGLPSHQAFFARVRPSITRKLDLTGKAVKTVADLRVVSIEDLGVDVDMVDITTETEDFIANGVISHNCFARNTHTYLDLDAGRDFDSQIVVKVNVAEVLRRELAASGWQRESVALGTNTDPYQRAEGRYRLMPGIIDALADSRTPFSILTKGTLLRRDLPQLQNAASRVPVSIAMSIAMPDEALRQTLEAGAPTFQARLDTVRAATDAGFAVTVFLMPIVPHLTDSVAVLDDALGRIAASGARRVVFGALHLRPGAKEWFWQWLEREHPELVPAYRGLYPGASAYAPTGYRKWLAARVRPLLRRHRLGGGAEEEVETRPVRPGPVRTTGRAAAAGVRLAEARLF
ncbi:Rv2578c family radical SAM protein [Microbacterium aurum]